MDRFPPHPQNPNVIRHSRDQGLSVGWLALASGYLDCMTGDIGVSTVREHGVQILVDSCQWLTADELTSLGTELAGLLD